jgi:putative alpha-1,2-mannosidase
MSQPAQCPLAKPILPGNDDSEQMSAWYVVQPGNPTYALSSPIFSKVGIQQTNGKDFTIRASPISTQDVYIQSARLNGKEFHNHEITHADIVPGGELTLEMGSTPNVDAISLDSYAWIMPRRAIERSRRDSQRLGFAHRQFP